MKTVSHHIDVSYMFISINKEIEIMQKKHEICGNGMTNKQNEGDLCKT